MLLRHVFVVDDDVVSLGATDMKRPGERLGSGFTCNPYLDCRAQCGGVFSHKNRENGTPYRFSGVVCAQRVVWECTVYATEARHPTAPDSVL